MAVEIIPAILPAHFSDIEAHVALIKGAAKTVQIDVVDGVFASNSTWPYTDQESFERLREQEEGLPLWEDVDYEFDLMVDRVDRVVEDYVRIGAQSVVVHATSAGAHSALELLSKYRHGDLALEVGVALGAQQSAGDLMPFLSHVDFVQVMGIDHEGLQGQPFDEASLALVRAVRTAHPELPIQVDGGVSLQTARSLVEAGAARLVVGSAIFAESNPRGALQELKTEAVR